MSKLRFAEGLKVQPIKAPSDIVATATATSYIDLNKVNWATFLVSFGALTTTDTTGEIVITVEASTAGSSNATEGAIAFEYRVSGAVDTDNMGDRTAATASGAAISESKDNTVVIVDVDPAVVAASGADRRYVRLVITPTADLTATVVGVIAVLEPRYPGKTIPSST